MEWSAIEKKIHSIIATLFRLASGRCGVWRQCCALYGIDILLIYDDSGQVQPMLIETNYSPDPSTMLSHDPDFYNNMILFMFGGVPAERCCVATLGKLIGV